MSAAGPFDPPSADDAGRPGGSGPLDPAAPGPSQSQPPQAPPAYPGTPPAYPGASAYPGAAPAAQPWGGGGTEANNLAVWSLVLAVLGWVCFGFLTAIPAIIVGGRAKRAAAQGRANNAGMATAGIVLGWIQTVLSLISTVVVIWLVATRGWDGFLDLVDPSGSWPRS